MGDSMDSEVDKNHPRPRSLVFHVLSFLFLLSVFTLIIFLVSNLDPVEEESLPPSPILPPSPPTPLTPPPPPSDPDSPYHPIDPEIIPDDEEKDEGEDEEGFTPPPIYKVGDTKPPRERQPHPEEFDVDDLPFSRGMNPLRERRQTILYRLAPLFHPLFYNVRLNVSVKGRNGATESSVHGSAQIHFRINGEGSNMLEFHFERPHKNLELKSLKTTKGESVKWISSHYNEVKRTAVFMLARPMKDREEFVMEVTWSVAARNKGVMGLYETWNGLSDGGRAYQLATQGEPMNTRKWMPCFDEPAMKAELFLTIEHPSDLNARSNSPILSSTESSTPGVRTTVFKTSRLMSPYLFAWSLTDYPSLSGEVNGVTVTVVARHENKLNNSLKLAKQAVKSYFSALSIKTSHVFEKIDDVFVPDHISAMENVGHITSGYKRIEDGDVYVHELMHQYFGNLITLSWWDEVWINEGLTTMYEIDGFHGIGTEKALEDLRKRRNQDIRADSLRKTIALKNEVTTEVEAWANFPKSYSKGSVVLFMMRNLLGEAAWKEGVETFLNKFAFQAVKGDDFLRTIKEVIKKYYADETPEFAFRMAKDFFELKGFPLLKMKREGRKIELRQVRFVRGIFDDTSKEDIALSRHIWRIPVHLVKLDGSPYKTVLMSSRSLAIEVETDEELVLDPKKIMYCRVVYDRNTYKQLAKSEMRKNWSDLEPILHDLLHSSYSGYVEPEFAFDVIYDDFRMAGDMQMISDIYMPLMTMFNFDKERLLRINGLLAKGSKTGTKELYDPRSGNPPGYACKEKNITSVEDALKENSNYKDSIKYLFCPAVKNSTNEKVYETFLASFLLGDNQTFHPADLNPYIEILIIHYPNLVADFVVKLPFDDEHEFAEILRATSRGFGIEHTEQLRRIFERSPQAARENRDFITKIFNAHYAAISEARELGEKIEAALAKHLERPKLTKSRGKFYSNQKNLLNLSPESIHPQNLQYY